MFFIIYNVITFFFVITIIVCNYILTLIFKIFHLQVYLHINNFEEMVYSLIHLIIAKKYSSFGI